MKKLFWKVAPAPTGPYRSFEVREWPTAYYDKEKMRVAAMVCCEDAYWPPNVKTGNHAPLTVRVACYFTDTTTGKESFKWRKVIGTYATLSAAKARAEKVISANPEVQPRGD